MAVFIKCPADGKSVSSLNVNLKLTSRNDGRCCVKGEVRGICRHRKGDGVRAEHCLLAEGGNHYSLGICHRHTDKALLCRHFGVVARNAVVVGIAHGYHAKSRLFRLFNSYFHSLDAEYLSHSVVTLDNCGKGSFKNDLGLGVDLNHASRNFLVVTNHSLNTVRFYSRKVRLEKNSGNLASFFLAEAVALKGLYAKVFNLFVFNMMVLHFRPLFKIILHAPVAGETAVNGQNRAVYK